MHFGELLDAVQRGERVIVERGGLPRAAVIPIADLERVRGGAEREDRDFSLGA